MCTSTGSPRRAGDGLYLLHQLLRRNAVGVPKEYGCKCEVINLVSCDDTALGHLERHFFGTDEPWEGDTPPITLYQAHTAYSEVEYVSAQLRRLARGGVRWRDMGCPVLVPQPFWSSRC